MTTYSGWVWKYDGELLIHMPVADGDKNALIITIYQDQKDQIWVGTDNLGVFQYNGYTFERF
jgi:ligand-binding sensor domain-containing protein